jgi:hypothetical protein
MTEPTWRVSLPPGYFCDVVSKKVNVVLGRKHHSEKVKGMFVEIWSRSLNKSSKRSESIFYRYPNNNNDSRKAYKDSPDKTDDNQWGYQT